jgi:hypothetical protein
MRNTFAKILVTGVMAIGLLAMTWSGSFGAQRSEDTLSLVVVGAAPVVGGKVTAARQSAIANGLMEAVALAAIEILPAGVFVENFKVLSEKLLERAEDYIQDFKVLSEAASDKHHRVVLQATVVKKKVNDLLSEAALLPAGAVVGSSQLTLSVEGSGNLAHFVKFRKALGGLSGVESIRIREMMPNETALLVAYKGSSSELAAALAQQAYDTFEVKVIETSDQSLRVAIVPK